MKFYEKYPEILNLQSEVKDKKYKNNISKVYIDQSIFMPSSGILLDDYKTAAGFEVIDVRENKDKTIVSVKGRVDSSKIDLLVDKKLRYRNLYYNTAYILFQIFLEAFYGNIKTKLYLSEDKAYISLINYRADLDAELFDEMINYAIDSNLPIKSEAGISEVLGLGTVINSHINFDNTYKIRNFKIKDIRKEGKNTIIGFVAGR